MIRGRTTQATVKTWGLLSGVSTFLGSILPAADNSQMEAHLFLGLYTCPPAGGSMQANPTFTLSNSFVCQLRGVCSCPWADWEGSGPRSGAQATALVPDASDLVWWVGQLCWDTAEVIETAMLLWNTFSSHLNLTHQILLKCLKRWEINKRLCVENETQLQLRQASVLQTHVGSYILQSHIKGWSIRDLF